MNLIRYLKGAFLILSVGFMAGGACLLIHPDISAVTICMALGVLSILYGAVRLAGYFPMTFIGWPFNLTWRWAF